MSYSHHSKVSPVKQLTQALSSVSLYDSLATRQVCEVEHILQQIAMDQLQY